MDFSVEEIVKSNSCHLASKLFQANLVDTSEGSMLYVKKYEEIGDGNLNIVYRITLNTDVTVILKYAPPFIKILGPSFPLTQERLEVEYNALMTYNTLCPGSVPIPLLFDKKVNSVIMEDLAGWSLLRSELIEGKVDIDAIKHLMVSIATSHNLSAQTACGNDEHKRLCTVFSNNDMVSVTEQYVFVKPFINDDPTNRHDSLLNDEVVQLRCNSMCRQRAENMRKMFVECKDCLCHGDLHTGSVMIKNGQSKLFDIEFTLMGPNTFDLGVFIANLLFAYIHHQLSNNTKPAQLVKDAITVAIQSYLSTYNVKDMTEFISSACGFIGCELIRRVIGAAHVIDLSSLPQGELIALKLGKAFLLASSESAQQSSDMTKIINMIIEQ